MLDLVESALHHTGVQFQRIDGSKSLDSRRGALDTFKNNASCVILLASLGSAAVGYRLFPSTILENWSGTNQLLHRRSALISPPRAMFTFLNRAGTLC